MRTPNGGRTQGVTGLEIYAISRDYISSHTPHSVVCVCVLKQTVRVKTHLSLPVLHCTEVESCAYYYSYLRSTHISDFVGADESAADERTAPTYAADRCNPGAVYN